jgi:hypothetical protein
MKQRIEGNHGGDFLEIEPLGGNLIRLEVGHCCVQTIDAIVPIEFITAVLSEIALRGQIGDTPIQDAIRAISWPRDFVEDLAAQVKDHAALRTARVDIGEV